MKKSVKIAIIIISVLLSLTVVAISTVFILSRAGRLQFHKNDKNITADSVIEDDDGILYKGNKYKLNTDVVSFLLIGIDKSDTTYSGSVGLNGQADTLLVVAIDTNTKNVSIIPISRETLVDVNQYTTAGEYSGSVKKQICLAYDYGKDEQQCSENVLLSVSRVLYGINVSSYITMDLAALEKISNSVGSIPVYVNEDYRDAESGYYYKKGQTINVKGKSAVYYIHWRTDDVNANTYRMERQKSFITSFVNKVSNEISKDFTKVVSYYNIAKPYVATNITLSQTTYLATTCLRLNLGDAINFKSIPGETFVKDGYVAFTPDAEKLTDIVVETFYKKVPKTATQASK